MGSAPGRLLKREISGIVFDLDDTLYPQKSFKKSGFKAVCRMLNRQYGDSININMAILQNILDQFGPSYPYIFDRFLEYTGKGSQFLPLLVDCFINHQPQISCYRGVLDQLKKLSQRYRLGLLTDGRASVQENKVKSLKLSEYFSAILYSDTLGLSKPSSDLYAYFENTWNLPPSSLIYIGDNPHKDFITAKKTGMAYYTSING